MTVDSSTAIARAVGQELSRDRWLRGSTLGVSVEAGIVVLTGTLPLEAWRQRARRVARAVRDVRAVVDRTSVVAVKRSDRQLAREVSAAIRGTRALVRLPIRVRVEGGIVELSGGISSWDEQQLAERVALGVPGVRFCQNLLSARPDLLRTDAIMKGDIESRLDWDPLVTHDPIEVEVTQQRVRLSGTVGSAAEHRRAVALAWIKGALDVDSSALRVDEGSRPNPNVRMQGLRDEEIRETLVALRAHWPSLKDAQVDVSVLQGVVTVRGNVQTLSESRAFEALARSAVGVISVQNQLRGPWWRPPAPPLARPRVTRPRTRRR